MNFRFLSYSLDDLAQNAEVRHADFGIASRAKTTRYPIRAFRYWFVCHALIAELRGKPDAVVVDMGAERGQMRRYCAGAFRYLAPDYPIESQTWIGLDKCPQPALATAHYRRIVECDFDRTLPLESGSVDALICIHVMEHLPRPDFAMSEIARVLAPGGIFCGGSPTAPEPVSSLLHQHLRHKMQNGTTGRNGHINSHSPHDWKKLVGKAGLKLEFISGSHLMRLSGSPIENSRTWARLNLLWGGIFPGLGSEVYLVARKSE